MKSTVAEAGDRSSDGSAITVSFYGDVCLDGIDPAGYEIDDAIVQLARSSELNVANLECPLTHSTDSLPLKSAIHKAEPVPSPILELFDVFSLANNHIMDYRTLGLQDTLEFLDKSQKRYFGAGLDRGRALKPLVLEHHGLRFAFVGFSRWQTATRNGAGTAPDRIRRIVRLVRELSEAGCFVVVYPHWNYEYIDLPAPSNRKIAHRLIDAGAHLVVGSHPHVIQGYEPYRGRMIYHSMGNFVFDTNTYSPEDRADGRIHQSFVLTLEVNADRRYSARLTPVYTHTSGVRVLRGDDGDGVISRLAGLSQTLEDEANWRRSFYRSAVREAGKVSREMGQMIRKQGPMYVLSRLHRIKVQDVKIKLYSLLSR
ncbi:MAG: CapA family protein [Gemmatimonadota bacterium]|nr:MAG: CapA family protein [Gemmatimonadota bacterium]